MAEPKSPFPGMNPYLEDFWSDMHTRLVVLLSNAILPQLPEGLEARIEEGLKVDAEDGERRYQADVLVAHTWSESLVVAEGSGGVSVVEPDVYRVVEMATPRRVEIIDVRHGGKLITVIELLSPSNKTTGWEAYTEKIRAFRNAGVNVVEIDLLRQGRHAVAIPLHEIPLLKRLPYIVCAARGDDLDCFNVWHIGLLQTLPAIAIPLRRSDRDAVVDLQSLIDAAYREGFFARRINYREPLDPPLPPEAQARVDEFLKISKI